MKHRNRLAAVLIALAGSSQPLSIEQAFALPANFPPIADTAYLKECGSCHMAYPGELLPAQSWTRIVGSLDNHFGDSAQVDAATQQRIRDYLVAHAADKAQNEHSHAIMQSLHAGEIPSRITAVPYIAGVHAAVLLPAWGGKPRPKTLGECSVCHIQAQSGNFTERRFTVTDDAFQPVK
jgi:hypothetical protein